MHRMWVEERVIKVVEDDLHRGADVAVCRCVGRRGVGLDAGRDHGPALARELDLGARQECSLEQVLLRGALGEHLSGALIGRKPCGVGNVVAWDGAPLPTAPGSGGQDGIWAAELFCMGRPW